ncbi:MAG TPA: hypothetical protein VM163_12490 [bacterium]|nr:hypothetical protein [bacterium]
MIIKGLQRAAKTVAVIVMLEAVACVACWGPSAPTSPPTPQEQLASVPTSNIALSDICENMRRKEWTSVQRDEYRESLIGKKVEWNGYIDRVRLKDEGQWYEVRISNEDIYSKLPAFVAQKRRRKSRYNVSVVLRVPEEFRERVVHVTQGQYVCFEGIVSELSSGRRDLNSILLSPGRILH